MEEGGQGLLELVENRTPDDSREYEETSQYGSFQSSSLYRIDTPRKVYAPFEGVGVEV